MSRGAVLALLAGLIGVASAAGQLPEIRGYYLNVPTWSDSNLAAAGGLGDLNRLRLMTEPRAGAFEVQIAYEQLLTWSQRPGPTASGLFVDVVPSGGEWLDLQWTIEETDHVTWAHRFDRLAVSWAPAGWVTIGAGRQAISWASTLSLTPADPFIPFDPSDPFREYRAGVDALRLQFFPGPLSDIDLVVRPASYSSGQTLTALVRGRTVWRSWELSAWLGALHDEPAVALGAVGAIGPVAVRGEATLRQEGDSVVFRGAVGLDGRFDVLGRDLYYGLEYQRDGFGASRSEDLLASAQSPAFARGELQVLGRDELVVQGSYQVHPLWTIHLFVLTNLEDPSTLASPAVSYSVGNEAAARGGVFFGLGDDTPRSTAPIPSEYGLVPLFVYASLSVFF